MEKRVQEGSTWLWLLLIPLCGGSVGMRLGFLSLAVLRLPVNKNTGVPQLKSKTDAP